MKNTIDEQSSDPASNQQTNGEYESALKPLIWLLVPLVAIIAYGFWG